MRTTEQERKAWCDHLDKIHGFMSKQFAWKIGDCQIMERGSILKDICLPACVLFLKFCLALLLWWICLSIWIDKLGIDIFMMIQIQPGG